MKREPGLAGSNDYSGQGGKDETHRERFVRAQRGLHQALQPYVCQELSILYSVLPL